MVAVTGDDVAMSTPPYPPPQPGRPSQQVAVAPPPPPVRTAIVLVWVQLAVGVLSSLVLLLVPGLREQLLAPAQNTQGLPPNFGSILVAIVVVSVAVGLLFAAAYVVVVTVFLRRGHRWVRTVILVFASLAVFGVVTVVLQAIIYAAVGPNLLVPTVPNPVSVVSGVVNVALYAAILVLLFRPASRRWLDERTAQRRWAAQQRRAAAAGGGAR